MIYHKFEVNLYFKNRFEFFKEEFLEKKLGLISSKVTLQNEMIQNQIFWLILLNWLMQTIFENNSVGKMTKSHIY